MGKATKKTIGWQPWQKGDPVTVNRIVWGQSELERINEVYQADWFGPGRQVNNFAYGLTKLTGHQYALPVNSGSSALLLAVRSLIDTDHWRPGQIVIHPALTFPTSIAPAIQCGMIPLFVDVNPDTYQIKLDGIKEAVETFGGQIAGAVIPHILGNVSDMDVIKDLMGDKPIIEDCCDTLDGRYKGQHVGKTGTVAAVSFYGSHHVTTAGVGGALLTDDVELFDKARSMAYWGRTDYSLIEDPVDRFVKRYWYETIGYDFQMTEIQAAFGLGQLERLPEANKLRAERWGQLSTYFRQYAGWFILPRNACQQSDPSWFGFPLTIKAAAPFDRRAFAAHLIAHKIEIRPVFTGNILQHPAYRYLAYNGYNSGKFPVADRVGEAGLFLPAWGMSEGELEYMLGVMETFFNGHKGREEWR